MYADDLDPVDCSVPSAVGVVRGNRWTRYAHW
jgi:hypothetical protein